MATVPVQRTSQGLVNALFDCIDKLNGKEITAEDARAVSHTVRSIVQIARLEMDFREFADAGGEKAKIVSLAIDKK